MLASARVEPLPVRGLSFDALTRRELEVLGLLCHRLTDPEIADHLYIGVRTVESHVAGILGKLGVNNRRAAASAAVSSGLVPQLSAEASRISLPHNFGQSAPEVRTLY